MGWRKKRPFDIDLSRARGRKGSLILIYQWLEEEKAV